MRNLVGGGHLDMCPDPGDLFLEVVSPVLGQRRDIHDATQPLEIVLVVGMKPRDLGDCNGTPSSLDQGDRVARRDVALGDHPEIEAETAARQKSLDDIIPTKSQSQLVAWQSRLGDHDFGRTDPKPVTDL